MNPVIEFVTEAALEANLNLSADRIVYITEMISREEMIGPETSRADILDRIKEVK